MNAPDGTRRVRRVQRVAAYNVCLDAEHRLLLCRLSAITEAEGAWTLPGGGVEFGEHPEQTALRELREETGLVGRIEELLAVDSLQRVARPDAADEHDYHSIRILYRTTIVGGTPAHETEGSTDRAEWFTADEAARLRLVATSELGMRLAYGERP